MPGRTETFGDQTTQQPDLSKDARASIQLDEPGEHGASADLSSKWQRTIGYARVSTSDQDLRLQVDALKKHGVVSELLFTDKKSGASADRPGLERCLATLQEGDVLLVWRLDRLGRSMRHLVEIIDDLRSRNIGFRSICDGSIDTTTASGELIFSVFAALAQFERRLIQERTKAGLAAARARGRIGGRPAILATDPKVITAKALYRDRNMEIAEICRTLSISRATLYRYLRLGPEKSVL